MGTPARIYVKATNGREGFDSLRVNYDGDLVGQTLVKHYNTPEAIEALLLLGECSSLDDTLEDSVFYHRDRGEPMRQDWYREMDLRSEDYVYRWEGERWEVYAPTAGRWVEVQ